MQWRETKMSSIFFTAKSSNQKRSSFTISKCLSNRFGLDEFIFHQLMHKLSIVSSDFKKKQYNDLSNRFGWIHLADNLCHQYNNCFRSAPSHSSHSNCTVRKSSELLNCDWTVFHQTLVSPNFPIKHWKFWRRLALCCSDIQQTIYSTGWHHNSTMKANTVNHIKLVFSALLSASQQVIKFWWMQNTCMTSLLPSQLIDANLSQKHLLQLNHTKHIKLELLEALWVQASVQVKS